jgi:hypothetical protein
MARQVTPGPHPHSSANCCKWTKESALKELENLIDEIDSLHEVRYGSAPHVRWFVRTVKFLSEVFGDNSLYAMTIARTNWGNIGGYMLVGWEALEPERAIERRKQQTYSYQLDNTEGLLQAAVDELVQADSIDTVYKGKNTAPEASTIIKVINLAERKLRKIIRTIPTREKEVQDSFETLLIGADVEYSRKTDSIEYSSKTYTPDFTAPKSDLAIELKLCPKIEREKEMIAEINDDILAYKTKYGNILFVIYDCGFIRDVDRFIEHFEKNENVIVKVVKH